MPVLDNVMENDDDNDDDEETINNIISSSTEISDSTLECVRCAAHTLQLCVWDATKKKWLKLSKG